MLWGPKDHIDILILETMITGHGLSTNPLVENKSAAVKHPRKAERPASCVRLAEALEKVADSTSILASQYYVTLIVCSGQPS